MILFLLFKSLSCACICIFIFVHNSSFYATNLSIKCTHEGPFLVLINVYSISNAVNAVNLKSGSESNINLIRKTMEKQLTITVLQ